MGEDKFSMSFNGRKLIDFPLTLAKKIGADEVLVIGNKLQDIEGPFKFVKDELDEVGPLGGILTGLKNSSNEINVVLPCDSPFINIELINTLLGESQNADVVVPSIEGRLHPVVGVFRRRLIDSMSAHLFAGGRKMMDFLTQCDLKIVEEEIKDKVDPRTFANLNSKSDIRHYEN